MGDSGLGIRKRRGRAARALALPNPESRIPNPGPSREQLPQRVRRLLERHQFVGRLLQQLAHRADLLDRDVGVRVGAAFVLAKLQQQLDILVLGQVLAQLAGRTEEHTSELQSLMRISYAVFCLKNTNTDSIE